MSWTYSGDPCSCLKDEIRFLVGDTNEEDQLLMDDEILYALGKSNEVISLAAVRCCDAILAKIARDIQTTVGPMKVLNEQKTLHYRQLKQTLLTSGGYIAVPVGAPTTPGTFSVGMDDFI